MKRQILTLLLPLILLTTNNSSKTPYGIKILENEPKKILSIQRTNNFYLEELLGTAADTNSERDSSPYRFIKEKIMPYKLQEKEISGNTYAILINPSPNKDLEGKERFERNIRRMYSSLEYVGVPSKNIQVLENKSPFKYKNLMPATRENIFFAINNLYRMPNIDLVIFYITNHGMSAAESRDFVARIEDYEYISGGELTKQLSLLNAKAIWFINAPCKGYFATYNVKNNLIGHSFSGPKKNTVGGGTRALYKTLIESVDNPKKVDYDKNGRISIEEIAKYTALNYWGTSTNLIKKDKKREVHVLTSHNLDPNKIYLR